MLSLSCSAATIDGDSGPESESDGRSPLVSIVVFAVELLSLCRRFVFDYVKYEFETTELDFWVRLLSCVMETRCGPEMLCINW